MEEQKEKGIIKEETTEYVGPTISFRGLVGPVDPKAFHVPEEHNPLLENLMIVKLSWRRRFLMFFSRIWKRIKPPKA